MTETDATLQDAYDEFEGTPPEQTREQQLLAALTDIGRRVFEVPEGKDVEIELSTLVQGVSQLVVSERRLRKALQRLLNANVSGTISDKTRARERGTEALQEVFDAQRAAGQALKAESGD